MAVRDYNGRKRFEDKISLAAFSAERTSAGWIESTSLLFYAQRTNSANVSAGYVHLNGFDWIKIQGENTADDANQRGSNLTTLLIVQSAANEASVDPTEVIAHGIPVVGSKQYKLKFDSYFNQDIVTSGTGSHIQYKINEYDQNGVWIKRTGTDLSNSDKGNIKINEVLFTTQKNTKFIHLIFGTYEQGSLNVPTVLYVKNISFQSVLSARSVAVDRGVASNRFVAHDFGTSLRNDGTNASGVTIPAHADFNFNATGFTFNIFVKRIESLLATKRIVNKRSGNSGFLIQTRSEGRVEYGVGNGSSLTLGTFPLLRTKGWNSLGITCNLTAVRSYLNGVFVESRNLSGYADAVATALTFLSDFSSGGFNGLVDMAKIFNRPFTDAEMAALAQKQVVDRVSLIGEWNADEASGTTVNDSSGRGHHGTISGSTVYSTDIFKKARSVA